MTADPNGQTDLQWLAENGIELFNRYRGRWIAVKDHRVIADGETATEVEQKARQRVPDGSFVLDAFMRELPDLTGFQDNADFMNRRKKDQERWVLDCWLKIRRKAPSSIRPSESPDYFVDDEPIEIVEVLLPGRKRDLEYKDELNRAKAGLRPRIRPDQAMINNKKTRVKEQVTVDLDLVRSDGHKWVIDGILKKIGTYARGSTTDWTLIAYITIPHFDAIQWPEVRAELAKTAPLFTAIDALSGGGDKVECLWP